MMKNIEKALLQYWGYDSFLPLQRQAIECTSRGKDSIVVLPTGGGKSLCFQAPAVVLPGLTIVVSPLIALMKDQVDSLGALGIAATFINSSLAGHEVDRRINAALRGEYKLLYVAPERLESEESRSLLQRYVSRAKYSVRQAACCCQCFSSASPTNRAGQN